MIDQQEGPTDPQASSSSMTRLLVSVRSAAEARAALSAGADLIDVKDPAKGSLGAPDSRTVAEVVAEVARRVPTSVALGELRETSELDNLGLATGVNYAKLGLAGCGSWPDWSNRWAEVVRRLPPKVRPVAVVYADGPTAGAPEPDRVVAEATRLGCVAVLVDTFDKSRGSLVEWWTEARLAGFVATVRGLGMLSVLGGSLTMDTIPRVASLRPDYIAVRGAVCREGRNGPLEAERVRQVADLLIEANSQFDSAFA
jgi:hypothetical protein